jgi:hypothetical protein
MIPRTRQFTVRTLIFLVFCICGLLAGYRVGFDRGYTSGDERRLRETLVARVYPVGDLIAGEPVPWNPSQQLPDYSTLIELITAAIEPTSWDDVGGPGSIVPQLETLSVVVNQKPSVHEALERLLTDLRRVKRRLPHRVPPAAVEECVNPG